MSGYPDEARLPNVIRASRLHLILAEWIGLKISRQRVNQWIHQGVRGYVLAAEKRPDPARPSAEILVVRREDLCQFLRDALGISIVRTQIIQKA